MVNGDAGRIRQIMLNLIGNAIKFTSHGGVKVSIEHETKGKHIKFTISISDTGIGIPENRIDSIFEKFSQAESNTARRFGGTGLGLTISNLLAKNMGGGITVQSEENVGSTFILCLDVELSDKSVIARPKNIPVAELLFLEGKEVLIAEDNKTNRLLIEKMLAGTKASIIFAHDGLEVVEHFFDHEPDLVLMDIAMPHQDGRQASREIRKRENEGNTVPIIALTANAFKEDADACLAVGMNGFVSKPIRKATLNAEINRVWEEFQPP